MEAFWSSIRENLSLPSLSIDAISWWKLFVVILIFSVTLFLREIFASIILKKVEKLTQKTQTTLDDELLALVKQPLSWLIFLGGLWTIKLYLSPQLTPEFLTLIDNLLHLSLISIAAIILYRTAPVFGQILSNLAVKTETELDDLLVPYLPKIFQTAAIVVIVIKTSEFFLGASAGAIIGLLGGAGVALGLLFKDIIYDWCCTVIIYVDNLYRPNDLIRINFLGKENLAIIEDIGLRSTKIILTQSHSVIRIPNSKMIGGIVINLSQNGEDKVVLMGIITTVAIDGISSRKTASICKLFREIPKSLGTLHDDICLVIFKGIKGNSRVIELRVFANKASSRVYWDALTHINLEILAILEREGIGMLEVEIRSNLENYQQSLQKSNSLN